MKKFLIMIFLSCSTFFIISAFVTKSSKKNPVGFQFVLNELENCKIGFDIQKDISELKESLDNVNNNTTTGSGDVIGYVKAIALNIYYSLRFAIKMFIHVIVATLNVIILVLRCIGFADLNYITLSGDGMTGSSGQYPENLVPLYPWN